MDSIDIEDDVPCFIAEGEPEELEEFLASHDKADNYCLTTNFKSSNTRILKEECLSEQEKDKFCQEIRRKMSENLVISSFSHLRVY